MAPSTPTVALAQQQAAPPQNAPQQMAAAQPLATPTVIQVDQRVAVPDGCIELISNGSFEARGMGWSQQGSMILPEYSAPPAATSAVQNDHAIRLGLVDKSAVSGISATQQVIRLPKESSKITLGFRYYPLYNAPVSPGDFQYVDIYEGDSGQFLGRALGVQENKQTWIERHYDLSPLAGKAVRIFFIVSNDGVGGNIAMYVDDVSVLSCRSPKTQTQSTIAGNASSSGNSPSAQSSQALSNTEPISGAQPYVASNNPAPNPIGEAIQQQGIAFGRVGGLLAVLGIAGAAVVLLGLTKRFSK